MAVIYFFTDARGECYRKDLNSDVLEYVDLLNLFQESFFTKVDELVYMYTFEKVYAIGKDGIVKTILSRTGFPGGVRLVTENGHIYAFLENIYHLKDGSFEDISSNVLERPFENATAFSVNGKDLIAKIYDGNASTKFLRLISGEISVYSSIDRQDEMWISHIDKDKTVFQHITETDQKYIIHSNIIDEYHMLDIDGLISLDIVFTRWGGYVMGVDPLNINSITIMSFDQDYNVSTIAEPLNPLYFFNSRFFKDPSTESVFFAANQQYRLIDIAGNLVDIDLSSGFGFNIIHFFNGYAYLIGKTKIRGRQIYRLELEDQNRYVLPGKERVIVFPNPADNMVRLDHGGDLFEPFNVSIYHSNGALVREFMHNRLETVDVSGLLPGLYYIKLIQDNYKASGMLYKN